MRTLALLGTFAGGIVVGWLWCFLSALWVGHGPLERGIVDP